MTMRIALWVAQVLLALLFGMSGALKAFAPVAELARVIPWSTDMPLWLVRFIGFTEIVGAIGLILPAVTRIKPGLTPLAALGLAVIMLLAAAFHAMRGEFSHIPLILVYGAVAVFVAWGRARKAPITPR